MGVGFGPPCEVLPHLQGRGRSCQPLGHAQVKRIRVFPMADMYPITCRLKLPQQACRARRQKSLQISGNEGEAATGLPPHRTAHCSPLSSAGWAVHATMPPARRQKATRCSHSLQTKPIFSPPKFLPQLQDHQSWAPSQHRAEARAAQYLKRRKVRHCCG